MSEIEGVYLLGQDVSTCNCGADGTVKSYFVKTTRYIEKDMSANGGDMAWECEKCDCAWVFPYDPRHDKQMNFCPCCGRKIIEFVREAE